MKRFILATARLFIILVLVQTGSCSKDEGSKEPGITNVVPSSGGAGRRVVIESNDAFSGDVADQKVTFNRSLAEVISVTKSSMTVRVPYDAGSGNITVVSAGKTLQGPLFEYIVPASTDYFIRFKNNGVFMEGISLTDSGQQENCVITEGGKCHELVFFIQGHKMEAYFVIVLDHDNTAESLQAMFNVPIPIRPRTTLPAVTFGFNTVDNNLISDDASQTGTFRITTFSYHSSSVSDYDIYNAEGTFECVIRDKFNDVTSVVTEGTFRMPIATVVE